MYHFFMAVHVFACLAMIFVVLLQTGRGAGLQVFGGGGDSLITTTGGSSFMRKLTIGLASAFAATSLFLTILQGRSGLTSVTSTAAPAAEAPAPTPAAQAPAQPVPAPRAAPVKTHK